MMCQCFIYNLPNCPAVQSSNSDVFLAADDLPLMPSIDKDALTFLNLVLSLRGTACSSCKVWSI